jgi:hypothetical protein
LAANPRRLATQGEVEAPPGDVAERGSTPLGGRFLQDDRLLPFWTENDLEIRVIHLTRDVRSWVHSRSRKERQQGRWLPELRPLLRWWRLSARDSYQFKALGNRVLRLGYEELALQPDVALRRVCAWLELPFVETMLQPGDHSTSHVLSGNRMRFDPNQRQRISTTAAGCRLLRD